MLDLRLIGTRAVVTATRIRVRMVIAVWIMGLSLPLPLGECGETSGSYLVFLTFDCLGGVSLVNGTRVSMTLFVHIDSFDLLQCTTNLIISLS